MSRERRRMRNPRLKWVLPLLSLLIGIAYLLAATVGGKPQLGLEMFGIMAAFAVGIVVLGGRSETIRGLRGDERDERFAMLDLRATAYTALVLILAILGGFIYEIARGRGGAPYFWLGALAGVTYLVCVIVLRFRS